MTGPVRGVVEQVARLRRLGFGEVPLPNLALWCADGRVLFAHRPGSTDVVVVRGHDAAVAARVRDPVNPAQLLDPAVVWRWAGELSIVVDELLREFYAGADDPPTDRLLGGYLDQYR